MSSLGTDAARIAVRHRSHPHPDARLQAARDHYLICCPELFGRQNSLPDREAPHPCGVAAFLKQIDRESPQERELHLIVDNYATHKHQTVREWVKRHPCVFVDFTPTGSSWMNLVERFF